MAVLTRLRLVQVRVTISRTPDGVERNLHPDKDLRQKNVGDTEDGFVWFGSWTSNGLRFRTEPEGKMVYSCVGKTRSLWEGR